MYGFVLRFIRLGDGAFGAATNPPTGGVGARHLADLHQQVGEVLLDVAGVGATGISELGQQELTR